MNPRVSRHNNDTQGARIMPIEELILNAIQGIIV